MDIGQKVTLLRSTFCEGNNLKFAKLMNESPTTVSNWCQAKSLGKDVILKILASIPDVDANWLLMGNGDMLKSTSSETLPPVKEQEYKNTIKELETEIVSLKAENKVLRELAGLGERKDSKNKSA